MTIDDVRKNLLHFESHLCGSKPVDVMVFKTVYNFQLNERMNI